MAFVAVENAEPVVLAILGDSIELCTCLLEKSKFESDNISLQVRVLTFKYVQNMFPSVEVDCFMAFLFVFTAQTYAYSNMMLHGAFTCFV